MQIEKDVNKDIQHIKKSLKEELGVNYALPKYSFREGYKVHLMVQKCAKYVIRSLTKRI
jgi:hypothetical protein